MITGATSPGAGWEAVTVKVVNGPNPAASEAATSSVSEIEPLAAEPDTKLSPDSCPAVSSVIRPDGSTAPLSTQKPCETPVLSSSTSYPRMGAALLAENSADAAKLSLGAAFTFAASAVTAGVVSTSNVLVA